MGFFSVLLLNNAFEMKCKRFNICKHGLVGTWGLLTRTGEGITSFIQLFKTVFDFKKSFTDAGGGAIRSKFVRLYANRSGGTFGLNPSIPPKNTAQLGCLGLLLVLQIWRPVADFVESGDLGILVCEEIRKPEQPMKHIAHCSTEDEEVN